MTGQWPSWVAVVSLALVASFWGFWGAIEAFHEGWFEATLPARLLGALRYVTPCLVLTTLGALAVRWPRLGATLLIALGAGVQVFVWLTRPRLSPLVQAMFTLAPALLGGLHLIGPVRAHGAALGVAVGLPLAVLVACGLEPAWRVAGRIDDGQRGERRVDGNQVSLTWAPAGPGWERQGGVAWEQARERCRHLSADGLRLEPAPVDAWRLPSVDEAVRSLARHGRNAGGHFDARTRRARYERRPDKESPLWDTRSPVIYWWTASDLDASRALIVVYDGGVFPRHKAARSNSLGFRAVRATPSVPSGGRP